MQHARNDAMSSSEPAAPAAPGDAGLGDIDIRPVTAERWDDLRALFETSPVMSSCWCMSPRTRASEFSRFGEESRRRNREAMHSLVTGGTIPGLMAYVDGRAAGWIAVGPREQYVRLRRSRQLDAADPEGDGPVWSIVCFYTERSYRRQGLTRALIQAAIRHAAAHGAAVLEAYPVARWGDRMTSGDAYTGMAGTFRDLGFYEVGTSGQSRGEKRLIMRYDL